MSKNFDDFITYVKTLDTVQMQNSIDAELKSFAEERNMSEEEYFVWNNRAFSFKLTMKMLEEYHNWLND